MNANKQDYEQAAEDLLNDKVKEIGFDEVIQSLGDDDLHTKLADILFSSNKGRDLILSLIEDKFKNDVKEEGLINAIHLLTDNDDKLVKVFDALIYTSASCDLLVDRALMVWLDEIENRLGV